jgi:hypothetical protein
MDPLLLQSQLLPLSLHSLPLSCQLLFFGPELTGPDLQLRLLLEKADLLLHSPVQSYTRLVQHPRVPSPALLLGGDHTARDFQDGPESPGPKLSFGPMSCFLTSFLISFLSSLPPSSLPFFHCYSGAVV